MTTANERIRDAMIRHQIGVIRASGTLSRKIISLLRRTEKELRKKINDRLKAIKERGSDLGPVTTRRLLDLESEIRDILEVPQREISDELTSFLDELARREPIFVKDVIRTEVPVVINFGLPPAKQLRELVRVQPIDGRILGDWIDEFHDDDIKRMVEEIRRGITQGESTQKISRRIFGVSGTGGARKVTRREAEIISRTTTNAIANKARQAFFKENARFIPWEVWVATLDSRTCPQCGALDGRRFKVGEGPIPPAHPQCRCTKVPSIDGKLIGERPQKRSTARELLDEFAAENGLDPPRTRSKLPRGFKGKFDEFARKRIREMTGRVPASTTFSEFLERQTSAFQNDVLGKTRAELFRNGKLDLGDFVDESGRTLNLDDLMKREPDAFRPDG